MYPFIHLSNGLEIPSFFLVISLVLSVALFWVGRRAILYRIPSKKVLDLSLVLMVSSLVGARLFHVVYENPEYYQADPVKVFFLWDGGFVFFGGAVLAFISALCYFKWDQTGNRGEYFDTFAPVLAFAYGFGRMGCFLAGCCYGKNCELPWAVAGRHPTQLYALLWEVGVVLILLGLEKTPRRERKYLAHSGDLFLVWAAFHAVGRLIMEHFRDDFRGQDIFGLSISSFFSVVLLLIVIFIFLRNRKRSNTL